MQQLISIITPLFNRYELVQETWQSIQGQTYSNWEWIVVDDGSTDKGPQYFKQLTVQYQRVKFFSRETGLKGPSACRNLGVKYASGNYLLFLDSDDIISPNCLEKRVGYLENKPDLDFAVFTQALFTSNINENTIFSKFYASKGDYLDAFIADQHPWQTSGPLWRKDSFIKTDGFREEYTIMEDPELHIRALLMGLQFEVINDEPDFFYRLLPKTEEQEKAFWHNSIMGRMSFYRDLLPKLSTKKQVQALSKGILSLYKTFLLARLGPYQKEHQVFIEWVKKESLLSPGQIGKIQTFVHFSEKKYINRIPLIKGLLYKGL